MNHRERFLETLTFGRPDRPAVGDYLSYAATRERWEREGLPKGVDLDEYFGFDFNPFEWKVPVHTSIYPLFEETVLEETENYQIKRKNTGAVVRVLKNAPPPAMPQWIRNPLESMEDWCEFRKRLDLETPGRLPQDFLDTVEAHRLRGRPVGMWVGGSYGVMRDWWGVEALSMLFYDNPSLIEEMMERLTHLSLGLLDRVLASGVRLDWVMFWEDLAFKTGPLVSPQMFRKYCLPYYHAVMDKVRSAGIPVSMVDSDGHIDEIIPIWLDAGVTVMHPLEVASGMDVTRIRKEYGKQICFFGGIDKRALAGSRSDIEREVVPKLEYCFAEGGFIPACDHAVPPDVSFDNYRYFRELVRRVSERVYGS